MTQPAPASPLRTPLHPVHEALGARMTNFAQWSMPLQYEGIVREHHCVRQHVGLFDVSHMGRLVLRGSSATVVLNRMISRDLSQLPLGKACYALCCQEDGTILDDVMVYAYEDHHYLVICNASNRERLATQWAAAARGYCEFQDTTANTYLLALQGPASAQVLEELGAAPEALQLKRFQVLHTRLRALDCVIARTGYTGEDGFEIMGAAEDAKSMWDALRKAGHPLQLAPIGLGARDTLRLEACLPLYGHEISTQVTPYEAGLGWAVNLDKHEFIGQDALKNAHRQASSRRLVGFHMRGRGIARHGYTIVDHDDQPIGHVSSGAPSPTLGFAIGLGYVPTAMASPGTSLRIDIRGKKVEAEVVATPFYQSSAKRNHDAVSQRSEVHA